MSINLFLIKMKHKVPSYFDVIPNDENFWGMRLIQIISARADNKH